MKLGWCRWVPSCCVGIALLATVPAAAGTIYWNMNDLSTPASSDVGNLTVSVLSQNNTTTSGTSASSASSGYTFTLSGSSGTASGGNNLQFSARAGALNTGSSSYLALTLAPAVGYSGTVTAIGFGSRSTTSGPTTLSLRASNDSYAGDVASFSTLANGTYAYFSNTFSAPLVIESGSSLTLRLYGSGGSSANSGNWRLDDLQLTVVVVPEPAALLLGLAGVAGATVSARRRVQCHGESTTRCGDGEPASRS